MYMLCLVQYPFNITYSLSLATKRAIMIYGARRYLSQSNPTEFGVQ